MKALLAVAALVATTLWSAAAPDTVTQTVTYNGETITMQLKLEPLRSPNFELLSQNATGGYNPVTPGGERSYIGTVDEHPGAVSCGILQDNGQFRGAVYFDRGASWFTLGSTVFQTRALDYGSFREYQFPAAPTVAPGQAGTTTYGYELGVDVDHDYFTTAGSSELKALEQVEYSVCLVRAIYLRDVLLRPYLGRVIVRADASQDPYAGLNGGDYLSALRAEWNTNHTDTDPDLVCGASPTKIGGGLAWVGVVGGSSGYSVNGSDGNGKFDVVFRHEMGHNWDCGHFIGGSPEGKGLMGGNQPARFSSCEAYRVFNHRNSRVSAGGILDDEGTFTAVELPPFAALDAGVFVQTADSSTGFDVMTNDHDANGQAISLTGFEPVSWQGGTVTRSGDELVYVAPAGFTGGDHFLYTITDTAGKTATGAVVVDVRPNDELRLYLKLDETTGSDADDASLFDHDCTVENTDFATAGTAGAHGNALDLDGIDDQVKADGVSVGTATVTMTAWIRQGDTQNPWAGIIFCRSGGAAGLNIGDGTELRYHWNGSKWGWNSGLVPPADVWTFVALVIEPDQGRIYMDDGSGMVSAVNPGSHLPEAFGTTYIGYDPNSGSRHFDGMIDEVRIYNRALSQAELEIIRDGGGAEAPVPQDGQTAVTDPRLSWTPGATAVTHDVYLGTDAAAVLAANQASPEFAGNVPDPVLLADLTDDTEYFWRVDTITGSTTLPGKLWHFTTATVVEPGGEIRINFGRDGSEAFAGGQLIGPTAAGSSDWNEVAGASGTLGSLVNSSGLGSGASMTWHSSVLWSNNDGVSDDEHRLATGYLDDGDGSNGDNKGVLVTLSDIPFERYRVYGLFATDQNQGSGSACGIVNFNVNGSWALGGNGNTTADAWGTIHANLAAHGSYWTKIEPGVVRGNYWVVETTGSTCTITGEVRNGSNRGCLTGLVIERLDPPNNPPAWNAGTVTKPAVTAGMPIAGTLAGDASDPDEGEVLVFSRTSGPEWLTVAEDGGLSGSPAAGDTGINQWTVRVTDLEGAAADALLEIEVLPANKDPIAAATFTLLNAELGSVMLDAGDSTDADGTIVSWAWSWSGGSAAGENPEVSLPAGTTVVTLTVTDDNGGVDSTGLEVTVADLASRIAAAGLTGADADPEATPFGDGVENILKDAFNMDLTGPDAGTMAPGGSSGLPSVRLVEVAGETYIRVEYVERLASGLIYQARKTSTLGAGSAVPLTGTMTVTPIGTGWQRVVIDEPVNPATAPRWFVQVEVALP
ncbi:LamG-like jellyroll fold domain-containing protein [Luteolibacter marinus]|uniref:LamG-like jellyroll fold domain-containing protein n=1 Tax=Luteolibacter marinus TaxID=2776705 RepID=UPI0018696402|nr:LamG-like jellyroll fold domain-containing protein [Luteolibacter marinus]